MRTEVRTPGFPVKGLVPKGILPGKFRFSEQFEKHGHCEKVAHTGVAIP